MMSFDVMEPKRSISIEFPYMQTVIVANERPSHACPSIMNDQLLPLLKTNNFFLPLFTYRQTDWIPCPFSVLNKLSQ